MSIMNSNYLKYLFKQNKKIIILIALIGFALCPVILGLNTMNYKDTYYYSYDSMLLPFGIYLGVQILLTYVIPLINFRFMHYKRSVDTFLSLPIKRKVLFNTITTFSLLEFIVPFIINVFLGSLVVVFKGYPYNLGYVILYLVLSIGLLIALYFINTFITLKCNNTIDSIICMLAYTLLPFVAYIGYIRMYDIYTYGTTKYIFIENYQSIITMIISCLTYLYKAFNIEMEIGFVPLWYGIYLLIGVVALVFSVRSFEQRKAEDSEQLTDSKLMYKLLIPLYTVVCISFFAIKDGLRNYLLAIMVIFIIYCIATFIANRQLKITRWIVLMFISAMLVTNIGGYIFGKTLGKQFSLTYPEKVDEIILSVTMGYYDYAIYANCDFEDKETTNDIKKLQTQLVNDHYDNVEYKDYNSRISISYKTGNNYQHYHYSLSNKQCKELYKYLHQKGVSIERYNNDNFKTDEIVKLTLEDIEKLVVPE